LWNFLSPDKLAARRRLQTVRLSGQQIAAHNRSLALVHAGRENILEKIDIANWKYTADEMAKV
jgi:hypothetical protein